MISIENRHYDLAIKQRFNQNRKFFILNIIILYKGYISAAHTIAQYLLNFIFSIPQNKLLIS